MSNYKSMAKNIQAIRGMNDILPGETPYWQCVENKLCNIVESYGYQEIRFPLLESTELFVRTVGEATDIVEKEMYTFEDRNGDSLTLRPEGTAGCVRAGIQHGLLYNQVQRLWYKGQMFRHERPQKGRFRQFNQFGVEAFGLKGPDIDAEILSMTACFWDELQIKDKVKLHLNSLGNAASRAHYRSELVEYFVANFELLDDDSKRRVHSNPLRILDSKNSDMREVISKAPQLINYLDDESREHFFSLRRILDALHLEYVVDPCLVRGLDYYCFTVFEWVTTKLGAQNAICAGGHYDKLVEELGGKSTPAIGFALGFERIISLLGDSIHPDYLPHIYFVLLGEEEFTRGLLLAEKIRVKWPKLRLVTNCGGGNLSAQLKRADKSGAKIALIIGENELKDESVTIKYLREDRPQKNVKFADVLGDELGNVLS